MILRNRPLKKSDSKLYQKIEEKIALGNFIILKLAKQRQKHRNISDLDILRILEGKKSSRRRWNKCKDKYIDRYRDWNYCIEGYNLDDQKIRVIVSFNENFLLIITVIRLS